MSNEIELRLEVINHFKNYVSNHKSPNEIYMSNENGEFTLIDILNEIETKSPLGNVFYEAYKEYYQLNEVQKREANKDCQTRIINNNPVNFYYPSLKRAQIL